MLVDNHGRTIDYMRLAVTDRCNLRCFYCMPEEGITYVDRKDLMSFEEMYRMINAFGELGISKLRITGGEPFVRKGIMEFLEEISRNSQVKKVSITTNGTFTEDKIEQLERMGIHSINLSLDSLDRQRFFNITRRNLFDQVMSTLDALVHSSLPTKINAVVMDGRNIEDIYPMIELTKDKDIAVRFIEEMPFNGSPDQGNITFWPMKRILEYIKKEYIIEKLPDPPSSTAYNYRVKRFKGSFGIIAAYTRTFCASCNRIRVTPQGDLRTCLYGKEVLSLRDILRNNQSDEALKEALKKAIGLRAKDGFEAEKERLTDPISESMATIGG
jgi:cyclic pyranopterin phosphate synthase